MYADILFLTEFLNDYLILLAVSCITGHHTGRKKLIAGALCGALISTILALFTADSGAFFNIASGIGLCLLMISITFSPRTRSDYFRLFLYTYSTAFILGGIINFFNERFPAVPSFIIFVLGFLLLKTGIKLSAFINKRNIKTCTVRISFPGQVKNLTALMDTGNLLYDEKSKYPVSIINRSCIPDFKENNISHSIPFKSLGCEFGTLEIMYVPYMCIEYQGNKKIIENAPLGISKNELSSANSYQMIICPDIIN